MPLREQLLRVELLHKADLRDRLGAVYLPEGQEVSECGEGVGLAVGFSV